MAKAGTKKKHKLKKAEPVEHIDGSFQILGCDLSLTCPGFALLYYNADTGTVELIRKTHVANKEHSRKPHGRILTEICDVFADLCKSSKLKMVVRERAFARFANESQIINKVAGATEMILWQVSEQVFTEYAPTSVKKSVTGSGKATKEEVAEAVNRYLINPVEEFSVDDESDACAVALAFLVDNGYVDQSPLPQFIKEEV